MKQPTHIIWLFSFCIVVEDLDKACPRKLFGVRHQMVEVILGPETTSKTQTALFTPSPRNSPQK